MIPKHFDGKRYQNPDASKARGFPDVVKWALTRHAQPSPKFVLDVTQSVPPRQAPDGELVATLVNHSTVLLQQGGFNILTDPIWSMRASPLSRIGPGRRRIPGVRREDLPRIDMVLLSHNHYDHLDLPTLRWLASLGNSTFIVPVGVGRLLQAEGIGPVYELDWGESRTFGAVSIHSVPAVHFSARGLFDRNKTLWSGYVILSSERVVYFAGDTAFGNHFAQIREWFGPPSLSLLPIGAYEPRWFMSPIHMAPWEAVKAHEILGSGKSIAIHHGTFALADDGLDTAREQLSGSMRPDSFLLLKNGESAAVA